MANQDPRYPEIKLPTLGGLNERPSPASLRPGEFDVLEGLYPAQVGLLRRVPGKGLLARVPGNPRVLQVHSTNNVNGDILISTTAGRYVYSLAELRNRVTTPNLTYPTITEEESMSMALIVQREANGTNGGSIRGYLTGTDSAAAIDTFYGRRLTNLVTNSGSTVVSFTASTGGAGAVSTPGTFTLAPGTYRVTASFTFAFSAATVPAGYVIGLWNSTDNRFEYHDDGIAHTGTDPIISTLKVVNVQPTTGTASTSVAVEAKIDAQFIVSASNKTFQFNQKGSDAPAIRSLIACGQASTLAGANVNGAAVPYYYSVVKILKTA